MRQSADDAKALDFPSGPGEIPAMKLAPLTLALTLLTTAAFAAPTPAPDDKAAFAQLKSLAGTWHGHSDCGGKRRMTVIYHMISGGSTVMETLMPGTKMEMVSMYHLDREGELVMKHYCSIGNQPQMEYDRKHSAAGTLVFKFDGGDVDARRDMHVHNGTIRLVGKNQIESEWTPWKDGQPMPNSKMSLKRAAE